MGPQDPKLGDLLDDHDNKVISMSNCTKNWNVNLKNEGEIRFGEIFEVVNIYQRITCNTKEKLGGVL